MKERKISVKSREDARQVIRRYRRVFPKDIENSDIREAISYLFADKLNEVAIRKELLRGDWNEEDANNLIDAVR